MKRAFLSLSVVALAVTFNACEGRDAASLPEHYKHKGHAAHDAAHKDDAHKPADAKADPHAAPAAHPNPAPAAKPH